MLLHWFHNGFHWPKSLTIKKQWQNEVTPQLLSNTLTLRFSTSCASSYGWTLNLFYLSLLDLNRFIWTLVANLSFLTATRTPGNIPVRFWCHFFFKDIRVRIWIVTANLSIPNKATKHKDKILIIRIEPSIPLQMSFDLGYFLLPLSSSNLYISIIITDAIERIYSINFIVVFYQRI